MDSIDWAASARLSSARGTDEFVVRERFADEAPRVIIVCDRRPEMAAFLAALLFLGLAALVVEALPIESTPEADVFLRKS